MNRLGGGIVVAPHNIVNVQHNVIERREANPASSCDKMPSYPVVSPF